jgi:DNA-binding XRE family transcriptional regulator
MNRISHKFLTNLRQKNNWTQEDMSKIIGVSRPTYIALERGKGCFDINQLQKLADKSGCDIEDILAQKIIDEDKYKEILLEALRFGAETDGKIPKTKLAKLIYLADFGWYYQNLESMSGAQYRRLPQGPVPNYYFSAIDELFDKGLVNIEIKNNAQLISLTDAGKQKGFKKLDRKEVQFVKKVAQKWNGKRTSEIVAFTHEQLPYKICNDGEIIPYELITQQDPKYVY